MFTYCKYKYKYVMQILFSAELRSMPGLQFLLYLPQICEVLPSFISSFICSRNIWMLTKCWNLGRGGGDEYNEKYSVIETVASALRNLP